MCTTGIGMSAVAATTEPAAMPVLEFTYDVTNPLPDDLASPDRLLKALQPD